MGVYETRRLLSRGICLLLALFFVGYGCSGGGGVTPITDGLQELKSFNFTSQEGRIVLDAYLLSYNKKTREVSVTKARTAQPHYNVTTHAFGNDCVECVTVTATHRKAKHVIDVEIMISNNYNDDGSHYDAFDVRAIVVQIDTDGVDEFVFNEFDIVLPADCDYTDLYADDEGMPDDPDEDIGAYDGTNPFIPFYHASGPYDLDDRALAYLAANIKFFSLAINEETDTGTSGWTDDITALIMIDACQSNPPVSEPDEPYPNCPEPYVIEMEDDDYNYPEVTAGSGEQGFYYFKIFDHQHEYYQQSTYSGDFSGDLTFFEFDEDISGNVYYHDEGGVLGGGIYLFKITPDANMYAGLYEGVIYMQGEEYEPKIKHKIWANVEGNNITVSSEDLPGGGVVSAPVRVDWNNDDALETIFYRGNTVLASESDWGDWPDGKEFFPLLSGDFHGVPTLVGTHIISAFGYDGVQNYDCRICVLDCSAVDGSEMIYGDIRLESPPAGHPVPVDVTGDSGYEIFVLCEGGHGDDTPALNIIKIFDNTLVIHAEGPDEDAPVYFAPPAILEDSGTTYAFMVRHENNWLTLEAWDLADLSEAEDDAVLYYTSAYHSLSPVISKSGSDWIIYTPTYDKLFIHGWDALTGDLTKLAEVDYPEDTYNFYEQLALGDINGDGMEDVVVGLHGALCAYTGYRSDVNDRLQLIWSLIPEGTPYYFPSPALIDCNGDHYLDIITAATVTVGQTTYDIVAIDGSPFNNRKRTDPDDRVIWGYAISPYWAFNLCPVLSEKIDGDYNYLDIGVMFDDDYRAIVPKFKYHDEVYQPTPWLKAYYSLNNWNNVQESPPY